MEYSGETNRAEQSKLMGEGKMGYEKYYKTVVLSLPGAACREPVLAKVVTLFGLQWQPVVE